MNQTSIDLFNIIRNRDINICAALSNEDKNANAYFDHFFSPINSLDKNYSDFAAKNISFRQHKKYEIKTFTFEKLIETKNITIPTIDFLNIDVEANDYEVLEGFNLSKFKPKLICIEMLDPRGKVNENKYFEYLIF